LVSDDGESRGGARSGSRRDPEAAGPVELADAWCDELASLIAGASVNLVSRADRASVRELHVDESVAIAQHIRPRAGSDWMDLGTGGGLPGLVLAGSFPQVRWTLLDARAKKVSQVRQFAAKLGLANVTTVHARAEELSALPEHQGQYAGVVARAVASLELTIALGRGFVEDGELIVIRGPKAQRESAALVRWSDDLGVTLEIVERISGTMRPTWLIRVRGRGPAPVRFPQARRRLLNSARGGTR
jgi:16S rRNA (guanine527-N7)-methyltransferase